jgi:hypothetical protein
MTHVAPRKETKVSNRERIIEVCRSSDVFASEVRYAEAGGFRVSHECRLYKELPDGLVRVVFPTAVAELEDGAVVAITCLYDRKTERNVYAHTICAGPGSNPTLRAVHSPLGRVTPQPGVMGDKAVLHFVAWKQAAWGRFLNDELELGNKQASAIWIRNFWMALDRMFGGGVLLGCPDDFHWKGD